MDPFTKRKFGRINLEVTAMGFGTAPLGNFARAVDEESADAMVQEAWRSGIRYFDTAPMYGHGLAELRTGHSLRWKDRKDFVLSTKVGRLLKPQRRERIDLSPWSNAAANEINFDYSYDGVMRSVEDSLQRLALEYIDICFIHDIDKFTHGNNQPEAFSQAMNGAWRALEKLRSDGVVKAIGVGVNEWTVCYEALQKRDFDCFLLAGRYTLLEQNALDKFLPLCEKRNVAVVVGGGFNSGILATGAVAGAKYNYVPAPSDVLEHVRRIEAVCEKFAVPLPAAAMQFVIAHPVIASFIVGTRDVGQLKKNIDWFTFPIPEEFWDELKKEGLLREDAPTATARLS